MLVEHDQIVEHPIIGRLTASVDSSSIDMLAGLSFRHPRPRSSMRPHGCRGAETERHLLFLPLINRLCAILVGRF